MVQSSVFAILFAIFTVWCVLRGLAAWADGMPGAVVISALAALGGISLTIRSVRRALRSQG
jgi:hypothetical protein